MTRLSYGRQTIDDADIAAVIEALRSPQLTCGPLVTQFEAALARWLAADHAVGPRRRRVLRRRQGPDRGRRPPHRQPDPGLGRAADHRAHARDRPGPPRRPARRPRRADRT